MLILFIGIVVFLGVHSLTTFRETRTRLIERLGPGPFKGLYSVVAIAGFVLIVWGFSLYRAEGLVRVWRPPVWTRHLTIGLMWFAFVALACMNLDLTGDPPSPDVVLGVLSLIIWTLIIITSVKYVIFAMSIDNDGEGGILALMSLLGIKKHQRRGSSP